MVECIGVLAVIIVLTAMLSGVIYRMVDDANLAADVQSINSYRVATANYYRTKGTFAGPNGSVLTWSNNAYENWDTKVLLPERYLARVMTPRLGTAAYIRLTKITATSPGTLLTTAGNIGHIGNFNGNNGLYDLTTQYSANVPSRNTAPRFAWSPPKRAPASSSSWLQAEPMFACYDIPTGTAPPPAVPGGGGQGLNPQFPNFDPFSQESTFASQDPNNPTIVAELVLEGVRVGDAYRLSIAIDGFRQSIWQYWDVLGRVKYDMYDVAAQTLQQGYVFIYLGKVPPP